MSAATNASIGWSIEVERQEMENVLLMISAFPVAECAGEGIWVRVVDGHRVWSGTCGDAVWEVRNPVPEAPFEPRYLPARIILEANMLRLGGNPTRISIPDDESVAIVEVLGASSVIDLPGTITPIAELPSRPSAATVRIDSTALQSFLTRCRTTPNDPAMPDLDGKEPEARFTINRDGIALHIDWSIVGAQRTTYRYAADTTGEAMCDLPMSLLGYIAQIIDADVELTIDLPVDPTAQIILKGNDWTAMFDCLPLGALRYSSALGRSIEKSVGERPRRLAVGTFGFESHGRRFVAQLHDHPVEHVRITTKVCDGLFVSDALIGQINEANAGFTGGRLWLDGTEVWAAVEFPCRSMLSIDWALETLATQVTGFDVFLGSYHPFGATV